MAGKRLTCVDKSGRPLAGSVQVVRKCTIPGRSRATIHCRGNNSQLFGLGVVKGAHTRIQLASSLNQLTDQGEILEQCVNPFSEVLTIPSGSTLGRFHFIQEKDIGLLLGDATGGPYQRPSHHVSKNCTRRPMMVVQVTKSARLWTGSYASTKTCSAVGTMT